MSTGTRLILLLTFTLGGIMIVASVFMLRRQEKTLREGMRNELAAHAQTLQIALEQNYAAGRYEEARTLINRLGNNTQIYGVALFDERGAVLMLSDSLLHGEMQHPPELEKVLATGQTIEFARDINETEMFSIIMPVHVGNSWRGAFEVAQPVSFVRQDIARARRSYAAIILILVAAMFTAVSLVLRRSWAQPVKELLAGAQALGKGDLAHRVPVHDDNEFGQLAREFNRMADHLSEQRRAAEKQAGERRVLERELEHSERLAAVGRLAAGVAHEMGAPLNVIDARAEQLLLRSDAPEEKRRRNLEIIRAQAGRITHIVRQLLNLARPYNLRRQNLEVREALRRTVETWELQATQSGVEVFWNALAPVWIAADPDFLQQVFTNICANALQAMPQGGQLLLEIKPQAATQEEVSFVAVRFSDTGPGIPQEHLKHIFEPFYTTKDVGSGTGLGLPVARRIVEEHGGWLEVANKPGGGAVFTVYLPAVKDSHK